MFRHNFIQESDRERRFDPARMPARVALQLSGHTPGGQVRLFGWSQIAPTRFEKFVYGHSRTNCDVVVVARPPKDPALRLITHGNRHRMMLYSMHGEPPHENDHRNR